MDTKDKKEFIQIVNEAISEVVLPQFDRVYKEMASGFKQVDKRFEQVDKRFEYIDKRFEQMDERFDTLESKVDNYAYEVMKIREDLDKLQVKLDRIGRMVHEDTMLTLEQVEKVKTDIKSIDKRVKILELARR